MKKQLLLSLLTVLFSSLFSSYSQVGFTCSNPIEITSLPYQTTDNTSNYGDTYDVIQPSSCGVTSGNYMTGNDVFYSYTPLINGDITIRMTPNVGWSGIFVYDGCANVGVSCVGGVANSGTALREIPQLSVLAGHTYVIAISTYATPQTVIYSLQILNASNCTSPSQLSATSITNSSVNLSWGSNSNINSWEVAVVTSGTAPPNSGASASSNLNYAITGLLPSTSYQAFVRSNCGNGTFSNWSAAYTFTTAAACAVPTQVVSSNVTSSSVNYTWANTNNNFTWEYAVQLSSISTLPTSGTLVTTNTTLVTGLNASTSYKFYVRALCSNQTYTNWSVASNFVTATSCVAPTQIVTSNITYNSANVTWASSSSVSSWEYVVQLTSNTTQPSAGLVTTINAVSLSGLNTNTSYTMYVRALCTNQTYSSWSLSNFTTSYVPVVSPVCGQQFFDNGGTSSIYSNNSNDTYTICPTIPGDKVTVTFSSFDVEQGFDGLYVYDGSNTTASQISSANSAGSGAAILPGAFWGTTIPGPFTSSDASGCLTFKFLSDFSINKAGWIANVECYPNSSCVRPSFITISNLLGSSTSINWTENGSATQWQILVLPATANAPLQSDNGIVTNATTFQATGLQYSTAYKVYVKSVCNSNEVSLWSNAAFFTTLSTNCFAPTNVVTNSTNPTSASISWNQTGNVSQWEVLILPSGSSVPSVTATGTLVYANSYQATGLVTGNSYVFYVRAVCSATENSNWSMGLSITPILVQPSINVSTTQYTVDQLVNTVLVNNPCLSVSNITSNTGTNYGSFNGIGYFTNSNPAFPIASGIILSTGNALNAHGPNSSILSDGTSTWPGDSGLFNYIQGLGIDPSLSSYNNATKLEFDFTSLNQFMSFNFLFASDEYGIYQCDYADAFAFFLTDLDTGTTTNLAVIPGTTTPVSVVTIRNGVNNSSCNSANPAFFDAYTSPNSASANGASTNFNGQTVKMTASSAIIPNHNYHIKLVIADRNDSAFDSAVFIEAGTFASGPPECSDKIELVAFIDQNGNGIKDNSEVNFTYGSFTSLLNNTGNTTTISSPNGNYTLYDSNPINVYDLGFQIHTEYAPYYTLGTVNYNDINIPFSSGTQTLYFPVTLTQGFNDVSISITPMSSPRPGLSYINKIVYKNLGVTSTDGTLTFNKDAAVSISNISQTGTITSTNGFSYNFVNLSPYETRYIYVTMSVPSIPTVSIGDLLTNNASIIAVANDINLNNNNCTNTQLVTASYDPNDKMEAHGEKIQFNQFTQNDYLYYTIRFQNNGTANAINVRIEDFLDSRIDEQTIRVLDASHNYIMEQVNNKITWKFNYIQLPSYLENFELSKGFVTFKVKLKPGFSVGDIIPNTASIYFDTNPAIVTNTFQTEFVAALANTTFDNENFVIYPNPASSLIQISLQGKLDNIQNIVIYDMLGKSIKNIKNITSNEINVDVTNLSKGIYLVEITTESNLKTTKKLVIN